MLGRSGLADPDFILVLQKEGAFLEDYYYTLNATVALGYIHNAQ